jgi:hypothetical protein
MLPLITDRRETGMEQDLKGHTEDEVVAYAVEMATNNAMPVLPRLSGDDVIDWESALERLERWAEIDLGTDADSPLIRRIKRAVREARREG